MINSDEKGGQKEGDVLERSVEQQHDFDSMKGNVIEISNPEDLRLSKRRKVRLFGRNFAEQFVQVNCFIIIHQ